jgi:copper transporter 1
MWQMLFTWDTTDLCIVFPSWHISGTGSLVFSLLAIVLMTAGYEAIREVSRRYEAYSKSVTEGPRGESTSRILGGWTVGSATSNSSGRENHIEATR